MPALPPGPARARIRPERLLHATEHMDDAADAGVLTRTLADLASINRALGGTRATLQAITPFLSAASPCRVLDIGCGGADVARALHRHAARAAAAVTIMAVDRNALTARIAREHTPSHVAMIACADAFQLPFADRAFDVVMMNLTLHHFDDVGREVVLAEMARVARRAVLVNELERAWPHYLGARLLAATVWRGSAYTRHDGPVSVLRGFTAEELAREVAPPGFAPPRVTRRFFYRLVAVSERAATNDAAARTV